MRALSHFLIYTASSHAPTLASSVGHWPVGGSIACGGGGVNSLRGGGGGGSIACKGAGAGGGGWSLACWLIGF